MLPIANVAMSPMFFGLSELGQAIISRARLVPLKMNAIPLNLELLEMETTYPRP